MSAVWLGKRGAGGVVDVTLNDRCRRILLDLISNKEAVMANMGRGDHLQAAVLCEARRALLDAVDVSFRERRQTPARSASQGQ